MDPSTQPPPAPVLRNARPKEKPQDPASTIGTAVVLLLAVLMAGVTGALMAPTAQAEPTVDAGIPAEPIPDVPRYRGGNYT
jgi:hypothetical protein